MDRGGAGLLGEICSRDCRIRQVVGLGIALAGHVGNGKLERASELTADPVQGVEA